MAHACIKCRGKRPEVTTCADCAGTGVAWSVPFCTAPWNEVVTHLWQGCHDYLDDEGPKSTNSAMLDVAGFEVIVSLYLHPNSIPSLEVEHHVIAVPDGLLEREEVEEIDALAEVVAQAVRAGRKTLVRCQAGLNRSGLVTGLALVKLGHTPEEAIALIRQARGEYALCNNSFVDIIQAAA